MIMGLAHTHAIVEVPPFPRNVKKILISIQDRTVNVLAIVKSNTGLGFNTGTEIPTVFPKRVTWVWVWCGNLITAAIPYP